MRKKSDILTNGEFDKEKIRGKSADFLLDLFCDDRISRLAYDNRSWHYDVAFDYGLAKYIFGRILYAR